MAENKQNRSRRDFLKRLGWGGASAVGIMTMTPLSAFGKFESETADPAQMSPRENRRTGDKVSLLGYGMMRLPTNNRSINQDMVNQEVDYALAHGVNYFDTAPIYHNGHSEEAVGKALSRHPRDKYFVATKLSNFGRNQWNLESCKQMYQHSMEMLKVDYIDYYLLHSVGGKGPDEFKERFEDNGVLEFFQQERKAGRIRNLGFSFHGSIETFDYLIDNNDDFEWDFVQIQMNYIDWRHANTQRGNTDAEYLYNKLEKAGIQCVIMEPLLGGRLANVPEEELKMLKAERPADTPARWAFRWVGSHSNILTVLSGMTTMEVLQENVATYSPLEPCTDSEFALMAKIADKMNGVPVIPCTDCKYCMPCAFGLDIPRNFALYNKAVNDGILPLPDKTAADYQKRLEGVNKIFQTELDKKQWATKCTDCEACLPKCPQHIRIPNQMGRIAEILRKR